MINKIIMASLYFLGDLVATFYYARWIKNNVKVVDYTRYEMNMIVVWAWRKFGLHLGTLIAPILMFPFWASIIYGIMVLPEYFYYLSGAYLIIFYIHFSNWISIMRYGDIHEMMVVNKDKQEAINDGNDGR